MHSLVKKRKPAEHILSAQSPIRAETKVSQPGEENLMLQLQRTLGNQAAQQALQPGRVAERGWESAGEKTPVRRLPDPGVDRVMRQGLPAQTVTKWQSFVSKGYEEEKQNNLKGMEANFAEALKLIGEPNVNVATGGHTDPTKLKAGLNLDVLFKEDQGRAGFLTGKEFTAQLPMDGTHPDSAIIIGKTAFHRDSPINTIMVLEHERTHVSHQRSSVNLLKQWAGKADMKAFQKKFQKEKTRLEKSLRKTSPGASDIDRRLAEIKARMIREWFKHKGQLTPEVELLYEQLGTMKSKHFDSEVLSGLAGFMKVFPLVEIKNGTPAQDVFHELTYYPAEKGFWTVNSDAIKKQYQQRLSNFYCKTLNGPQRKVFDNHVMDYKNKKWHIDATVYFKMLESIKCKK